MNYIKELNAFYDTLVFNPLSGSAIAVWHALMHFNNKSGWQATFTVPASLLEIHSGIKGTTFKRARTELTEKGHIHVTPGRGNQAATYRMLSQIKSFTEPAAATAATQPNSSGQSDAHPPQDTEPQQQKKQAAADPAEDPTTEQENQQANQNRPAPDDATDHTADRTATAEDQTSAANHMTGEASVHSHDCTPAHRPDHNPVYRAAPLVKQDLNQTQTKQNPTTTTTRATGFYQQHFATASLYILNDIQHWISHMSDPLVLDAMKRALEQNKPTWRYVKGILTSWQAKGIRTVEAAAADDQQFRSKHSHTSNSRNLEKTEVIPAWFHERQQAHQPHAQTRPALNQAEWEECERLLAKYGHKKRTVEV